MGPYTFEVATPQPTAPTVNGVTNGDTLLWTLEGDAVYAAFFYLYLAPQNNLTEALVSQHVSRLEACGSWDGTDCTFTISGLAEEQVYSLYMQSQGAGGPSRGGNLRLVDGWVECIFQGAESACTPPPTEPTGLNAQVNDDGSITLTWTAAQNARVYQIWVGQLTPLDQAYFDTDPARELGCAEGGICTLTIDDDLDAGNYSWFVQARGIAGVPANNLLGWVIGPEFIVSDDDGGEETDG